MGPSSVPAGPRESDICSNDRLSLLTSTNCPGDGQSCGLIPATAATTYRAQQAVDHAEDRGLGADAEGEGEGEDDADARVAGQGGEGLTEVRCRAKVPGLIRGSRERAVPSAPEVTAARRYSRNPGTLG